MDFKRKIVPTILSRLAGKAQFLQIVVGPRQVGKTTSTKQIQRSVHIPSVYSAADTAGIPDSNWITTKWLEARALADKHKTALLILDEVQLVDEWQTTVKGLWDVDKQAGRNLHVIITGSSALLLKKGSESLAGRFEKHELLQWTYYEMHQAFAYTLEDYIIYGGYPGAAALKAEESRWKDYIRSSLIETVLTKDVVALSNISKPSLMQQLFKIACSHPAEIVSYNKFLGQLADVGNVTTLSDYRLLLEYAYLLKTVEKWSISEVSKKASKPKWIIRDNSLITALLNVSLTEVKNLPLYGRLIENTVISHLLKLVPNGYYWREKNYEVDHVFEHNGKVYAVEIKAGDRIRTNSGLKEFAKRNPKSATLIIGGNGIPIADVLSANEWKW